MGDDFFNARNGIRDITDNDARKLIGEVLQVIQSLDGKAREQYLREFVSWNSQKHFIKLQMAYYIRQGMKLSHQDILPGWKDLHDEIEADAFGSYEKYRQFLTEARWHGSMLLFFELYGILKSLTRGNAGGTQQNLFTEYLTPDTHKDEFLDHLDGLRDDGFISFDGDLENGGRIILREQKAKKKYAVALYAFWLEQGYITEPAKPWATLRKYVWHMDHGTPTQFSPKHLSAAYSDRLFDEQLARIRGEE
ncbi:MAG: hypothetical protein AB2L13_10640 [Spirochaetota bacterium]